MAHTELHCLGCNPIQHISVPSSHPIPTHPILSVTPHSHPQHRSHNDVHVPSQVRIQWQSRTSPTHLPSGSHHHREGRPRRQTVVLGKLSWEGRMVSSHLCHQSGHAATTRCGDGSWSGSWCGEYAAENGDGYVSEFCEAAAASTNGHAAAAAEDRDEYGLRHESSETATATAAIAAEFLPWTTCSNRYRSRCEHEHQYECECCPCCEYRIWCGGSFGWIPKRSRRSFCVLGNNYGCSLDGIDSDSYCSFICSHRQLDTIVRRTAGVQWCICGIRDICRSESKRCWIQSIQIWNWNILQEH